MDSKNVIWLSSFFALLFITFCVTKHLDDLNPNILSLPEKSTLSDTLEFNESALEIATPKLETPKLETPKLETPKLETPKLETPKLEVPEFVAPIKKVDTPTIDKKVPETKPIKKVKKPIKKPSKKPVHKVHPPKQHKTKKPSISIASSTKKKKLASKKMQALGRIDIDALGMRTIAQGQTLNQLNKLAFMYSIHKPSHVTIHAQDLKKAQMIKSYLMNYHVDAKNITILRHKMPNKRIQIILTGRK